MVKNTEINLSTLARDLKKAPSDAVVIGVGQGPDGPVLLENPLTAKSAEAMADSLKVLGVTGAADQVVRLPGLPETGAGVLVLAGVGKVGADRSPHRGSAPPGGRFRRAPACRPQHRGPGASDGGVSPTSRPSPKVPRWDPTAFTEYRSSKDGLKDPVSNAVIYTDVADGHGTSVSPGRGPA